MVVSMNLRAPQTTCVTQKKLTLQKRCAPSFRSHTHDDGARPAVRPSLPQVRRHRAACEFAIVAGVCARSCWPGLRAITVTHVKTRQTIAMLANIGGTYAFDIGVFILLLWGEVVGYRCIMALTTAQRLTSRTEPRASCFRPGSSSYQSSLTSLSSASVRAHFS